MILRLKARAIVWRRSPGMSAAHRSDGLQLLEPPYGDLQPNRPPVCMFCARASFIVLPRRTKCDLSSIRVHTGMAAAARPSPRRIRSARVCNAPAAPQHPRADRLAACRSRSEKGAARTTTVGSQRASPPNTPGSRSQRATADLGTTRRTETRHRTPQIAA